MLFKQKNIFTKGECDLIINLEKTEKRIWTSQDRSYTSFILKKTDLTDLFFKKLFNFFEVESGIKIQKTLNYAHYHVFETGDYFSKHIDAVNSRLYSIGCLLNDDFEGGDFKLYNGDQEVVLNKTVGNAYFFDVNIDHEITKVLNGTRNSIILFLDARNMFSGGNKLI